MFDELKEEVKPEAYLEPKLASTMDLCCDGWKLLTIFTNKFHQRCSVIDLWKCWDFQDRVKLGQIIVVVITRNVSRFVYFGWEYSNDYKNIKNDYID